MTSEVLIHMPYYNTEIKKAGAFGHAAMHLNGLVYSRSTAYTRHTFSAYMQEERVTYQRKLIGLVLNVSASDESIIKREFEALYRKSKNVPYHFYANNCAQNVSRVLALIGINVYGPWMHGTVTPFDLYNNLGKTRRVFKAHAYEPIPAGSDVTKPSKTNVLQNGKWVNAA